MRDDARVGKRLRRSRRRRPSRDAYDASGNEVRRRGEEATVAGGGEEEECERRRERDVRLGGIHANQTGRLAGGSPVTDRIRSRPGVSTARDGIWYTVASSSVLITMILSGKMPKPNGSKKNCRRR